MDTSVRIQPPRTLREVYNALPEGTLAQFVDGQLVMSPAPTYGHQKILNLINRRIADYGEQNDLGEVVIAPFDVHLDKENVFQPDIIFIKKEQLAQIQKDGLHGAPVLVIELLSPGTARYDLNQKKVAYERSGVREYWIVDPDTKAVQGYFLESGEYGVPVHLIAKISSRVLDHEFEF